MKQYNESEKLLLLRQYIESGMGARPFAESHDIPVSTFFRILRHYGNPDVSSICELMKKNGIPTSVEELQAQLVRERKAHEQELKRLQRELCEERLRSLANTTMIDLAEKKFNIQIRKKSAAK